MANPGRSFVTLCLFLVCCLWCSSLTRGQKENRLSICQLSSCASPLADDGVVYSMCQDRPGLQVWGRCCVNITDNTHNFTIGLDLSGCNIKDEFFKESPLLPLTRLQKLVLDNNPGITVLSREDVAGLTDLNYISVPTHSNCSCPGGEEAWRQHIRTVNTTVCTDQTPTCTIYDGACPVTTSHCVEDGPGLFLCLCNEGYHGYKCLRQGTFPMSAFLAGLGSSTVIVAAILWVLQRRHVKTA
ncbi:PREDICTED: all-trans retinoic acid-induced differentiation factor-like isoform X2 [Branchiostoma belcheri]|uniref:All-trans retinoic acid-induced differentiation factor-like isoform X2 n=1 Tax=Branchiostoma belcheri TaxID=7741 RepID=A0A6P5APZ2_BRABE|nr:PREDICTED: all-trans retinoic acid-induced differentiation factor-like isoform X2 [Branchiostoma belcheri]